MFSRNTTVSLYSGPCPRCHPDFFFFFFFFGFFFFFFFFGGGGGGRAVQYVSCSPTLQELSMRGERS